MVSRNSGCRHRHLLPARRILSERKDLNHDSWNCASDNPCRPADRVSADLGVLTRMGLYAVRGDRDHTDHPPDSDIVRANLTRPAAAHTGAEIRIRIQAFLMPQSACSASAISFGSPRRS